MGQYNGATALDGTLVDVRFEQEPIPAIAYRSHLTVYEEALFDGRFVGRYWNGAGFMSPGMMCTPTPPSIRRPRLSGSSWTASCCTHTGYGAG